MDTQTFLINTFRVPGDFLTYMYSYEIRIHSPRNFACMCIRICYKRDFRQKRELCVSNSKSMVL